MEKNKLILKVEKIDVSYGVVKALNDVSIEIMEGEIVCLIGPNNAGKSTLVETIIGINKVDSGEIYFMGQNITKKATEVRVASGICIIPERRSLMSMMTTLENLKLGAYYHTKEFKDNLEVVFEYFPILKKRKNQLAGTLSGGEQQMLAIARGLVSVPKMMMLDEPSLGLSPKIVSEVFEIIVNLNKKGLTILLSEQNARMALRISDRGYVIERGNILLSGLSEDLSNNKRVQHAYLGGGLE